MSVAERCERASDQPNIYVSIFGCTLNYGALTGEICKESTHAVPTHLPQRASVGRRGSTLRGSSHLSLSQGYGIEFVAVHCFIVGEFKQRRHWVGACAVERKGRRKRRGKEEKQEMEKKR